MFFSPRIYRVFRPYNFLQRSGTEPIKNFSHDQLAYPYISKTTLWFPRSHRFSSMFYQQIRVHRVQTHGITKEGFFYLGLFTQTAFDSLKKAMTQADASGNGMGAVLTQDGHLVTFSIKNFVLNLLIHQRCSRITCNHSVNPKMASLPIEEPIYC